MLIASPRLFFEEDRLALRTAGASAEAACSGSVHGRVSCGRFSGCLRPLLEVCFIKLITSSSRDVYPEEFLAQTR